MNLNLQQVDMMAREYHEQMLRQAALSRQLMAARAQRPAWLRWWPVRQRWKRRGIVSNKGGINMRATLRGITLMLLIALMAGCTVTPPAAGSELDYAGLLAGLRATGVEVTEVGRLEQPFFSAPGRVIRIGSQEVQVFEYAGKELVEGEAATISTGGSSVGTTMVSWMATPHFYAAGRLIVLYVGEDAAVTELLAAAVGPQIAGG